MVARRADEEGIFANTNLVIIDVFWREQSGIYQTLQFARGRFHGPVGEELQSAYIDSSFSYSQVNTFFFDDLMIHIIAN